MDDTICAISTALGVGAISIIRVSGNDSINIVNKIFDRDLTNVLSHTINYGHIIDNNEIIDEVLISVMKSPKTFTCEDIVEINCHGGIATTNKILELVIRNGARMALPGEFTKRAFLNGRIDLIEAEGVMDLINSKTEVGRKMAMASLSGKVSNMISDLRRKMLDIIANIEVNIDYPEYEDILVVTNDMIKDSVTNLKSELSKILKEALDGKIIKEGIKTLIIGRPNVGKSSLVNALLNEERSIVSNVSGTTRDSIDTPFTYNKRNFVVIDTAGIRKQGKIYENVERYSVLRALKAIDRSDVCLVVLNIEDGIIEMDKHIAGYAVEAGKSVVIVVNKWDKSTKDMSLVEKEIRSHFAFMDYAPIVYTSALTKKRIHTIMPEVLKVYDNAHINIKTSVLNEVISEANTLNPAPSYKGKRLKIYYVNQVGIAPPKILFHVNDKTLIHFSYERYLENKLRESFELEGTPIVLQFKNRGE